MGQLLHLIRRPPPQSTVCSFLQLSQFHLAEFHGVALRLERDGSAASDPLACVGVVLARLRIGVLQDRLAVYSRSSQTATRGAAAKTGGKWNLIGGTSDDLVDDRARDLPQLNKRCNRALPRAEISGPDRVPSAPDAFEQTMSTAENLPRKRLREIRIFGQPNGISRVSASMGQQAGPGDEHAIPLDLRTAASVLAIDRVA